MSPLPDFHHLRLVLPEIILVHGMVAVILVPVLWRASVTGSVLAAAVALGLALGAAVGAMPVGAEYVFDRMLVIDPFSQAFKLLLVLTCALVVLQWLLNPRPDLRRRDIPDYLCLLLGATMGMALMASVNNLVMLFIAAETASLPSYVLAGLRKRRRQGAEGALKFAILGAAATAVGIYGMSLVYGAVGTMDLPGLAAAAARPDALGPMFALGLLMTFASIVFKLSAPPLHFWAPDVFEGAPAEIATFLAVASKGAALCLLLRILAAFTAVRDLFDPAFIDTMMLTIAALGAVAAFWGNLAAIAQNNIKRLLAYSSIAHNGYMIMAASVLLVADRPALVAGALLFYLVVYLLMNVGAFTVVGLVGARWGGDQLTDYAGLIRVSPLLTAMMSLFLLSLFGLPGLGGFLAKLYLMRVMTAAGVFGFVLIAVLLINTVVSLYVYMKPVYQMVLVPGPAQRRPFPAGPGAAALVIACAALLVFTGLDLANAGDWLTRFGEIVPDPPRLSTLGALPVPTRPAL